MSCWVCGEGCEDCGAPPWTPDPLSKGGVYVLQDSLTGLVKIGYSYESVERRARSIAAKADRDVYMIAHLQGAPLEAEFWLHDRFIGYCDPDAARTAGLPNHTEWFWPRTDLANLIESLT